MSKEQVLVIGSEKLWEQWVWDQKQEYELHTYHISRMQLDIQDDDIVTAFHFVSGVHGDEYILQHLMGREFQRWLNLGVEVSQYARDYIKTRMRLN